MEDGVVLRSVGGYYTVRTQDGRTWECRGRGRLKQDGLTVLAGDHVKMEPVAPDAGLIAELLPRKTELKRPAIANVDLAIVVMAVDQPAPNPELLDRVLLLGEAADLELVVCFNKVDLVPAAAVAAMAEPYQAAGYQVLLTSAQSGAGIADLRQVVRGRIATLAGPSGVGKSALMNGMLPDLALATGPISSKMQRGKHTTRRVDLFPLPDGGLLADTPGFSQLDLSHISPEDLPHFMPEFRAYLGDCRFSGCLHHQEPGCRVKAAYAEGTLFPARYERYLTFLQELQSHVARRY